jgi:hypothetical protein
MAIYIRKNNASPTNACVKQTTQPEELAVGTDCEREQVGLDSTSLPSSNGASSGDGYVQFSNEGSNPTTDEVPEYCPPNSEFRGYHKFSVTELISGKSVAGECVSPYSRAALGKGLKGAINNREEQLIRATGKPVQLLRRQFTGPRCPCYSLNRGRSKKRCSMCYGTTFVPGYVPFLNEKDPLGRIYVRFEPHTETLAQKSEGMYQEVEIAAWTLSFPIVRQRDILIVYNPDDGTEEFRYEILNVTRNETFQGSAGAQKFNIKRINPNDAIYKLDPFALPNLADIQIDVSSEDPLIGDRFYDRLGNQSDGAYANYWESQFGDAAFSGMFTEGYKLGYELNFKRALNFQQPLPAPDFNEDGFIDDGYGPIFVSSNGKMMRFSTPQHIQNNPGINPAEVVTAEQKRYFLDGFVAGAKHGQLDGINELRARGILT